ncbi:MAG: Imm63 family immunity protein [Planctomycetota bacterium]|jgi:hypothetical protein
MDLLDIKKALSEIEAKHHVELGIPWSPTNDGSPHIEKSEDIYSYVITERGEELSRRETRDPTELLFWIVRDRTKRTAIDWELHHRKPGLDPRRLIFEKHIEILHAISPTWGAAQKNEYDVLVSKYPFDDKAVARADRAASLRSKGISPEKAWELAVMEIP